MYKLTDRRLKKALPTLEKYRSQLYSNFWFDVWALEKELRDCWDIGYQELKGIAIDMLKNERYRHVSIYYMEHCKSIGIISEFQRSLTDVLGASRFSEIEQASKIFWDKFKHDNTLVGQ